MPVAKSMRRRFIKCKNGLKHRLHQNNSSISSRRQRFYMGMSAIMFLIIVTLLISGGGYLNYWLYRNGAFKEPADREGCLMSSLGRLEKRRRSKRKTGR